MPLFASVSAIYAYWQPASSPLVNNHEVKGACLCHICRGEFTLTLVPSLCSGQASPPFEGEGTGLFEIASARPRNDDSVFAVATLSGIRPVHRAFSQ